MNRIPLGIHPFILPAGGVFLFFGEYVWPGPIARGVLDILGLVGIFGGIGLTLLERRKNSLPIKSMASLPSLIFVLAIAVYFLSLGFDKPSDVNAINFRGLLGWVWALLLVVGAPFYLLVELVGRSPSQNQRRVKLAGAAGLSLGLMLALLVSLNFNFNQISLQVDLAYFKITEPSSATKEVSQGLVEPVELALFFSPDSGVRDHVKNYIAKLPGKQFKILHYDKDLEPNIAAEFRVKKNGSVVLRRGKAQKVVLLDDDFKRAKGKLLEFDGKFLAALLGVSQEQKKAYYTVGHGERFEKIQRGAGNPRAPGADYNIFTKLFQKKNLKAQQLGFTEGLGSQIPSDAALVVIADPIEPFLSAEIIALREYLKTGGKLMVLLEPGGLLGKRKSVGKNKNTQEALREETLGGLLEEYGITFKPVVQAHETIHARKSFTKADRGVLVTVGFQAHPVANNLRKAAKQHAFLLMNSGELDRVRTPPNIVVRDMIRGMPGSWGDANGNFEFDAKAKEVRGQPVLAMTSEFQPRGKKVPRGLKQKGPRVAVFADADLGSDLLIRNRTNQLVVSETIRWLVGDSIPSGLPTTEKDIKIQHAKGDEVIWFYAPVFGVPFLVLIFGYFITRRRRVQNAGGSLNE